MKIYDGFKLDDQKGYFLQYFDHEEDAIGVSSTEDYEVFIETAPSLVM